MTTRLVSLLGILAMSIILLISTKAGADGVIEITNDTLVVSQPCYAKATTRVTESRGITTWCDVTASAITCTSTAEPVWCENGDAK